MGTPFGTDGPWLAAILDTLGDIADMLDARLPAAASADGGGPGRPVPVSEPAPESRPKREAVPVSEPDPDKPDDEDDDGEPVKVTEPAPSLPPSPPRSGKGSGLDAWQAYANVAGVSYPADASRADIIAACVDAGVIDREE
ncbi:hypothetical protein GCM10011608_09860 [Micromonospora sonchi]|uniref:Uncharacterized protein n=1 Tax=Micromonospora sonchi TaxID=1763543 RepID=A0A917TKZ5_9ACTN|nr:hypothetical protein [Micromonospora sonchi]GGM27099.1 hypothetical protein GCM10011608_09860 [Micromonospora sonchi]